MATFSKVLLSGSSQGKGIKVAATSSTGTTIHATGTSSSIIDEVWLWCVNSSTTAVKLTVQYGGTTSPDNDIEVTVPGEAGLMLVVPGLPVTGTGAAATTIYAFAGTTNVLVIYGYVNRIT